MKEMVSKGFFYATIIMFGIAIFAGIYSGCVIPTSASSLAFGAAVILCTAGFQCGSFGSIIIGMVWSCVAVTYMYIFLTTPEILGPANRLLLFIYFESGVILFWRILKKSMVINPLKAASLIAIGIAPVISIFIVRQFPSTFSFVALPSAALVLLYNAFKQIELKGGVEE